MSNLTTTLSSDAVTFIETLNPALTAEQIVQKVVDDWLENQVNSTYESGKTIGEKIIEINS